MVFKTKIKLMIIFCLTAVLSVFFAFSTAYAKVKVDVNNGPYLEYYAPSTLAAATDFKALLPSGVTSIVFDTYYVNPRWENGSFVTDYTDEYETLTGNNKTIFDNGGIVVFTNGTDVSVVSKSQIYAPANCTSYFQGLTSLKTITFNNFNTSNVTNMSSMFAYCSNYYFKSLDISSFDTSNVTTMENMFGGCSNLESITFPQNFNAEKVTTISQMFSHCRLLNKSDFIFNPKTSNELKNLNSVFFNVYADGSNEAQNKIVIGEDFDTSGVTDMSSMFCVTASINKTLSIDVSNLNTNRVTNMEYMFSGQRGLTSLDLSSFDTRNVTDMSSMFSNCENITSLDLSSFRTDKLIDTSYMFQSMSKIQEIYVHETWDLSKVTNSTNMFNYVGADLKGGAGTTISSTNYVIDKTYACIDAGYMRPYNDNEYSLSDESIDCRGYFKTHYVTILGSDPNYYNKTFQSALKAAINAACSPPGASTLTQYSCKPTQFIMQQISSNDVYSGRLIFSSTLADLSYYKNGLINIFIAHQKQNVWEYMYVESYYPIKASANCSSMFQSGSWYDGDTIRYFNPQYISIYNFDVTDVTNISNMFGSSNSDFTKLTDLALWFEGNFNKLSDISNVEYFSKVFYNQAKLRNINCEDFVEDFLCDWPYRNYVFIGLNTSYTTINGYSI